MFVICREEANHKLFLTNTRAWVDDEFWPGLMLFPDRKSAHELIDMLHARLNQRKIRNVRFVAYEQKMPPTALWGSYGILATLPT